MLNSCNKLITMNYADYTAVIPVTWATQWNETAIMKQPDKWLIQSVLITEWWKRFH